MVAMMTSHAAKMRILLAFLVAPIAPFLLFVFAPIVVILGIPIVYITTIVAGLPSYFWLKKHPNWQRGSNYFSLAGLIGFVAGTLLTSGIFFGELEKPHFWLSVWAMLHGACSGYIFWLIARGAIYVRIQQSQEASYA